MGSLNTGTRQMANEYEVREVPKVVVQGIRSGEIVRGVPMQQTWFVVEHIKTGQRFGEHDEEADAITECEKRNKKERP
jgi:hypothetical protein